MTWGQTDTLGIAMTSWPIFPLIFDMWVPYPVCQSFVWSTIVLQTNRQYVCEWCHCLSQLYVRKLWADSQYCDASIMWIFIFFQMGKYIYVIFKKIIIFVRVQFGIWLQAITCYFVFILQNVLVVKGELWSCGVILYRLYVSTITCSSRPQTKECAVSTYSRRHKNTG